MPHVLNQLTHCGSIGDLIVSVLCQSDVPTSTILAQSFGLYCSAARSWCEPAMKRILAALNPLINDTTRDSFQSLSAMSVSVDTNIGTSVPASITTPLTKAASLTNIFRMLPNIVSPLTIVGHIAPTISQAIGIPSACQVCVASGDNQCQVYGCIYANELSFTTDLSKDSCQTLCRIIEQTENDVSKKVITTATKNRSTTADNDFREDETNLGYFDNGNSVVVVNFGTSSQASAILPSPLALKEMPSLLTSEVCG